MWAEVLHLGFPIILKAILTSLSEWKLQQQTKRLTVRKNLIRKDALLSTVSCNFVVSSMCYDSSLLKRHYKAWHCWREIFTRSLVSSKWGVYKKNSFWSTDPWVFNIPECSENTCDKFCNKREKDNYHIVLPFNNKILEWCRESALGIITLKWINISLKIS